MFSHEELIEAFSSFVTFCNLHEIEVKAPILDGWPSNNITRISTSLSDVVYVLRAKKAQEALERGKERILKHSGQLFCYEFSKSDIDTIQARLNELRDIISSSEELEEGHRHRLLKRIEQLQSELHKKLSDLDRFWGLIGDAGLTLDALIAEIGKTVTAPRDATNVAAERQ